MDDHTAIPTTDPQDAAYLDHLDPDHAALAAAVVPVEVQGDVPVHTVPPRTVSAEQLTALGTGVSVRLANHNLARRRLRIVVAAASPATVLVGGHQGVTAGSGHPVSAAGGPLELTTTGEVWAVNGTGTDCVVFVLSEFDA